MTLALAGEPPPNLRAEAAEARAKELAEALVKIEAFAKDDARLEAWRAWRKYIAGGARGSWPSDAYESYMDFFADTARAALRKYEEETKCPPSRTKTIDDLASVLCDLFCEKYSGHCSAHVHGHLGRLITIDRHFINMTEVAGLLLLHGYRLIK